jgi:hypothetical protein
MTLHRQLFLFVALVGLAPSLWAQQPRTNNPNPNYPQYALPPNLINEIREGWNLSLGTNIGVSRLYHKIDFERTPLLDYYNSIVALPSIPDNYDWETFLEDIQLRSALTQPRFGFSGHLSYENIPAFINAEIGTSSSSYQKMYFAASAGLGKDFVTESGYYFSFFGGYKIVFQDSGFGAETILGSIGNDENRKYMNRFFAPQMAVGAPRGDLATIRGGLGKYIGRDKKSCVGVEFYGELDLTDETLRIARMNSLGLNTYLRFVLF